MIESATVGSGLLSLLTGVVGGASALVAKELVAPVLLERHSHRRRQKEIFRHYVAPLYMASNKLLWRYKEVFVDQRHQFFLLSTRPFDYNHYKRTSTLYRVACIIGWIRAIDLELNALPQRAARSSDPLQGEINRFQRALADGPDVELFRLQQVCRIWNIDVDELTEKERDALAAKFEVQLYQLAGENLREDKQFSPDMPDEERLNICRGLSAFLTEALGRCEVRNPVISETSRRIVDSLSYREALIYRDWQDAIGDAMIEKDETSNRRYKVIGFERFETLLAEDKSWMKAFARSVDDIDFERRDLSDFRHSQLRKMAAAVAGIVLAIGSSEHADLVDGETAGVARQLAAVLSETKGGTGATTTAPAPRAKAKPG